jgi:hypothetical protein
MRNLVDFKRYYQERKHIKELLSENNREFY